MLETKAEIAGQIAGTSDTSLEGKFKLLGEASAVDVSTRIGSDRIESNRIEPPPRCIYPMDASHQLTY